MGLVRPKQKFQDWFTQQWVVLTGRKIDVEADAWLMGPIGKTESIGDSFVQRLAEKEGLIVNRRTTSQGLISSFEALHLTEKELSVLSRDVVEFYEKTARYTMQLRVKWNPPFWIMGKLISGLFSRRIRQLNIPMNTPKDSNQLDSEIITLTNPDSGEVKYTIWYRTFKSTGEVIYSGVYTTCRLPSGKHCIKAIFPLPNGNATVIMTPSVSLDGSLVLDSSGKKFGDAGFYFLLNDTEDKYWARYVRSFRDKLIVSSAGGAVTAEQTLTMWHLRVLRFNYKIELKEREYLEANRGQ